MWGGRFGSGPDPIMEEINASIDFDRHLYRQDIAASKAHAAMLAKTGIISPQDAKRIAHGLDTILSEIEGGKFKFKRALEDIHMNVESRLGEHGCMGLAGGDILPVEMPVEADGGVDFLHDRVGAFAEASAPHFVAHDTLLIKGWLIKS